MEQKGIKESLFFELTNFKSNGKPKKFKVSNKIPTFKKIIQYTNENYIDHDSYLEKSDLVDLELNLSTYTDVTKFSLNYSKIYKLIPPPNSEQLILKMSQISELVPPSSNNLRYLYINIIYEINILDISLFDNLEILKIYDSSLKTLILKNSSLKKIKIELSDIRDKILNLSECSSLKSLSIIDTCITSITFNNSSVEYIYLRYLRTNCLDFSTCHSLKHLLLSSFNLNSLNLNNKNLTHLELFDMSFSSLLNLSKCINLSSFTLNQSKVLAIHFKNPNLINIDDFSLTNSHENLKTLNLSSCINLNKIVTHNLSSLILSGNQGLRKLKLNSELFYGLENLYISYSKIEKIIFDDKIKLKTLMLKQTNLQELDYNSNTLEKIELESNYLTNLRLNNSKIENLKIDKCPNLKRLSLKKMININFEINNQLEDVIISEDKIDQLNLEINDFHRIIKFNFIDSIINDINIKASSICVFRFGKIDSISINSNNKTMVKFYKNIPKKFNRLGVNGCQIMINNKNNILDLSNYYNVKTFKILCNYVDKQDIKPPRNLENLFISITPFVKFIHIDNCYKIKNVYIEIISDTPINLDYLKIKSTTVIEYIYINNETVDVLDLSDVKTDYIYINTLFNKICINENSKPLLIEGCIKKDFEICSFNENTILSLKHELLGYRYYQILFYNTSIYYLDSRSKSEDNNDQLKNSIICHDPNLTIFYNSKY
jgi:hypothetical protein